MKVLLVLAPGYPRLPLPGVEGIRRTYPQSFSIPLSPLEILFFTHSILLLLKCYGRHTQSRKRLKVPVVNSDLERSRSWLLFRPRRSLSLYAQGASNCTSQSFLERSSARWGRGHGQVNVHACIGKSQAVPGALQGAAQLTIDDGDTLIE